MERIKSLMQKFQEIYYSKHPKSAIDIDLMMDYTRIMYIDLIEWRREFTEPVKSDIEGIMQQENNTETKVSDNSNAAEPENTPEKEQPVLSADQTPIELASPTQPQPEPTNIQEEGLEQEHTTPKAAAMPVDEAPEQQAETEVDHSERDEIIAIAKGHTGISFEPPSHFSVPVELEDTLEEEAPTEPPPVATEVPAPNSAEIPLPEFKPYEPAKLFDNIVTVKDIRTAIGINDKYLFLNELFNNHKTNYEETLDELNKMSSATEAKSWVKSTLADSYKWDDKDGTVQSFYAVLDKHFSSR